MICSINDCLYSLTTDYMRQHKHCQSTSVNKRFWTLRCPQKNAVKVKLLIGSRIWDRILKALDVSCSNPLSFAHSDVENIFKTNVDQQSVRAKIFPSSIIFLLHTTKKPSRELSKTGFRTSIRGVVFSGNLFKKEISKKKSKKNPSTAITLRLYIRVPLVESCPKPVLNCLRGAS